MKENILYVVPSGSFGGNNVQLRTSNGALYEAMKKSFFTDLLVRFKSLNYFLQGDNCSDGVHWLMFEAWSFDDELFYESACYLAEKHGLEMDIY